MQCSTVNSQPASPTVPEALIRKLTHTFTDEFSRRPQVAAAPGRINLIGEHTDYNDGFVFPIAIDRHVAVAFAPNDTSALRVYAPEYDELVTADLAELVPRQGNGWIDYVAGVAWVFQQEGNAVPGLDMAVSGNVPIGAGLSSSAALEVACARAFAAVSTLEWNPAEMARRGRRAENEYVGVSCGIMDQFAAAASRKGEAMLLDCRTLETTFVSMPDTVEVVVMDTGVRRSLTDSAYNERTRQCRQAVAELQAVDPSIEMLRDVTSDLLMEHGDRMNPLIFRRARHVVEENERTLRTAEILPTDPEAAGRLMNASHESLRDLYEVSSTELDAMVEAAREHPACYGARLTGAGMGGCAVALIQKGEAAPFIDRVEAAYRQRFDYPAELFATEATGGARLVRCQ